MVDHSLVVESGEGVHIPLTDLKRHSEFELMDHSVLLSSSHLVQVDISTRFDEWEESRQQHISIGDSSRGSDIILGLVFLSPRPDGLSIGQSE